MENTTLDVLVRPARHFLPESLKIESWDDIHSYFDDLINRKIESFSDLEQWLRDWSEADSVVDEEACWRYIRMTCDTTNDAYLKAYDAFVSEIIPQLAPCFDKLNKKLMSSPYLEKMDREKYRIYLRTVRKNVEIYREENIPVNVQVEQERQKYGSISSQMTITYGGKELTMQMAANFLKDNDRSVRKEVYELIQDRRATDENELNDLLTRLIGLRNKIATNAGFKNYRDYKFKELGRFDYSVEDCYKFHHAISSVIVPVSGAFETERKKALGLDALKPWDTEVDVTNLRPLNPFSGTKELINKSVECFKKVDPWFAERLAIMNRMGHFDLESRKGKAPGGYNSTLQEVGVPFIFMNSVGSQRDLVTMVHEGGHAVHSFLTRELELMEFRNFPSEVAELASMSMELFSMEHWDVFYSDPNDLARARKEQMEKVLKGLTWIARVDKFQHWLYENPTHSVQERTAHWLQLGTEFTNGLIDWTGMEGAAARSWQAQLHIFEVPFYYIEYGFAQLGAIAMWRNYKSDPEKTIREYTKALSLGYTRSIPEIYEAAGIRFDFSAEYVRELADFVIGESKKIR